MNVERAFSRNIKANLAKLKKFVRYRFIIFILNGIYQPKMGWKKVSASKELHACRSDVFNFEHISHLALLFLLLTLSR